MRIQGHKPRRFNSLRSELQTVGWNENKLGIGAGHVRKRNHPMTRVERWEQ